jgi:anti-anti-sigma factor
MDLEVHRHESGTLEFKLQGDLTASSASQWKTAVAEEMEKVPPRSVLFNFMSLEFLDSSGISTLVGFQRKFKRTPCPFVILYESQNLEDIFVMTKLNKLLPLEKNYDAALERLKAQV